MAQSSYGSNSFNSKQRKTIDNNKKPRTRRPSIRSFQNQEITDLSQRDNVKIRRFSNYDPYSDMDDINSFLRARDFGMGGGFDGGFNND